MLSAYRIKDEDRNQKRRTRMSDPHGQRSYLAFTLIQMGEPTKPNSLRI